MVTGERHPADSHPGAAAAETSWMRPLSGVILAVGALPVLWLLGLEQILPPLFVGLAALLLFLTRRRITLPATAIPFLLFLVWQIASAVAIQRGSDWVVFGRNLISYATGWLVLVIVVNDVRRPRDLGRIVGLIGILGGIVSIIGLGFITGLIPAVFEPPLVGGLLPAGLRQSQFIQDNVLLREVGRPDARLGPITYPRVSAIFLFPTQAALGFIIFLSWLWFLGRTARRSGGRWLWYGFFFLSAIIFLFVAARVAITALLGTVILLNVIRWQRLLKAPLLLLPLGGIVALLTGGLLLATSGASATALLDDVFLNVRADSFTGRLAVYQVTLDLWRDRPLLGWGTPVEVAAVRLAPAGTHGEFLGILFRFGLVGFLLYATFLIFLWLQIGQRLRFSWSAPAPLFRFYLTITAILLAVTICGLSYGYLFDLSFVLLHWSVIGILHVDPRLVQKWLVNMPPGRARSPAAS